MVKKSFIDKKKATHFSVVHRSQHDPLIADGDASDYVLLPTHISANLKKDKNNKTVAFKEPEPEPGTLDFDQLIEKDLKNPRLNAAQYGIYFDDGYDYTQHLKPMGENPDAVFISAGKEKEKEKNKKDITFLLPSEALPSEHKLEVGMLDQPNIPSDYHYGMDPDVLDVLEALDDDACLEDVGDDFFEMFDKDDSQFEQEENIEEEEEEELDENASWEAHFRKFKQENPSYDSEGSEDEAMAKPVNKHLKGLDKRTSASKYSMSSSAMFRNERLTLLDSQFERIEEEYMEDEEEDEEPPQLVPMRKDLEKILDDFLDNYEVVGKKMVPQAEGETNMDKMTVFREELATETIKETALKYLETPLEMPESESEEEEDKRNNWDCQSILSTYSNIYNHPNLIKEPTKSKRIVINSRGFPKVQINEMDLLEKKLATLDLSDDDEEEELDVDTTEASRPDIARNKAETKEEKKLRKQQVKLQKKSRREEKKVNQLAYKTVQLNKKAPKSKIREVKLE